MSASDLFERYHAKIQMMCSSGWPCEKHLDFASTFSCCKRSGIAQQLSSKKPHKIRELGLSSSLKPQASLPTRLQSLPSAPSIPAPPRRADPPPSRAQCELGVVPMVLVSNDFAIPYSSFQRLSNESEALWQRSKLHCNHNKLSRESTLGTAKSQTTPRPRSARQC